MASSSGKTSLTIAEGVGAVAAASGVAAFYANAPFLDAATAINGGLGAGLGYLAGRAAATQVDDSYGKYLPFVGAIVVPGVAGGQWDLTVLLMGGAAYAGGMVLDKIAGNRA